MKRYEDLSEEEKQALIETCIKPEAPDFRAKCLNKPVDELAIIDCPVCENVFFYGKNDIHNRNGTTLGCVSCPKCKALIVVDGLKFSWM